jgi:hypothetical protein
MRTSLALVAAVVPFLPLHPAAENVGGAPPCIASQLRPRVQLQGATGSQLGGLAMENAGRRACVFRTPLRLVLVDVAGRALPLSSSGPPHGYGYTALILQPRASTGTELQLFNACGHGAPKDLWLVLPSGGGRVDLGISAEGRCDAPRSPPRAVVGPLVAAHSFRGPGRSDLRVTSIEAPSSTRAGMTLRYTVTIANRSGARLSLRHCPAFAEQLWFRDIVVTRQLLLNCGAFEPHSSTTFAMRLRVPATTRGPAQLEWSLVDSVFPIPTLMPAWQLLDGPDVDSYSWRTAAVTVR